jgi:ABC-2 type transport system permease protein
MIALAFKNFIWSKSILTGLLFLFVSGVVSICIGKQFLNQQKEHIADAVSYQQEHFDRHTGFFKEEFGLLLYYLRFSIVNKTENINALSIGQRDVNPSVKRLTIRNLEAQQYDTDLYNPTNLLLGNLDFSFVLIYLFPLIIIALTYNTLSAEQENGTWKLLTVQSRSTGRVLFTLLTIRGAAILAVFLLLMIVAILLLSLPLNTALLAFTSLSVLYLLFWMAVSTWVISWQKSSAVNAVSLLAVWVLLTIVAPAIINNYLITQYPVPEALDTAVKQRKGYHEKWDIDKTVTMEKFYAHYPQFKKYPLPDSEFSWLWYYAMQQMGDDDARQQANELKDKLRKREIAGNSLAMFIPTLHAQLQTNHIAQSGLLNHLQFLDSVSRFHEQKRLYFYPKIFTNAPVNEENWNRFTVEFYEGKQPTNWLALLLPLVVSCAILFVLSVFHLKNSRTKEHG